MVRHAQDFFSHITSRPYERLFAPIGDRTVTVMDGTGGAKQPEALSRGAREQLHLALRSGLVREFGERAERLPVVVDEVLSHQALQVVRALVRGRRGEAETIRDGTGTATREWREIMETLGLGE